MARGDDYSAEHLDWLVAGRSRNQRATLDLYKLIAANEENLSRRLSTRNVAHQLVGIAFSLWRAVFLSDLTEDPADQLGDIKTFLQSLIAHNAVLYQTDFNAREWTFRYYLANAVFRLNQLPDLVLPISETGKSSATAKDEWISAQQALETAIAQFSEMIAVRKPI